MPIGEEVLISKSDAQGVLITGNGDGTLLITNKGVFSYLPAGLKKTGRKFVIPQEIIDEGKRYIEISKTRLALFALAQDGS